MKSRTETVRSSARRARLRTYVDLTDELRRAIKDAGVTEGCAVAFCAHTTCALLINEWEDGALDDFRARTRRAGARRGVYYAHDDLDAPDPEPPEAHERANGHAHVKARCCCRPTSHAIPVVGGRADVRPVAAPDASSSWTSRRTRRRHLPRVRRLMARADCGHWRR